MKHLTSLFLILSMALFVGACNDHDPNDNCADCGDNNNGTVVGAITVDFLSSKKTAFWTEMGNNTYDFGLARDRTASDSELFGHHMPFPNEISAAVVTGQDQLIIEGDDLFEVYEVHVDDIGRFETLVRNAWGYPVGWQPNLFPKSEGEAFELEVLLSAFICAKGLNLYTRGCSYVPSDLFRKVGETSYYEWNNPGHAKYVFIIKR